MPIFDHNQPKIAEITFSFSEFAPACKKSVEIQQILECHDQTVHDHSWPCQPKNFISFYQILIYMNLYQYAKNEAISLIHSEKYGRLKNSAIWLAENILPHISGTFFPILWFEQEHRKYKFSL